MENTAGHGLLGEHGLSFWIETPTGAVLLDSGQGEVLLRNARRINIDLSQAKSVALSHGHYDHTGGLQNILAYARDATIWAHSAALDPKYTRWADGQVRYIGMSDPSRQAMQYAGKRFVHVGKPVELLSGLYLTGPIPRITEYEDTGGPFFADEACSRPDPLIDDQALYFDSSDGAVVVLGCAHSGIINTLLYIRQLTGGRTIHAVIGGMHLRAADQNRMDKTVETLRELDVRRIGLAHCTGLAAMARLCDEFADRCFHCVAGTRLAFSF